MNRIRLLDILRGFAIIGTLGTNIWLFSALTNKQNNYFLGTNALWWDSFDSFLSTLFLFLVNGKLLGMLTILFGVGLEIKYQQALRRKWMWPGIYIWGSVLLFLDGILHYIFVIEADVLMSYGVTAIIVSFLAKLHEDRLIKWFYGIGVFHLINVVLLTVTTALFPLGNLTDMISSSVYSAGSWVDQWIYRVENFWVLRAEAIFIIPQNICLFIVGILLMRNKVFTVKTGIRTNIRRKLLTLGYVAVPLNLLSFLPYEFVFFPVRYIFAPVMTLFYIGLAAWLFEKWEHIKIFEYLESIGKMALSNYMLQNVVASIVFYGWGMGIGLQKLHAFAVIGIWFFISIIMMIFSKLWLQYFKTGPIEWAWKGLTNFPRKIIR